MNNIKCKKIDKLYIDEFVKTCFERFGSMNKNDYEVALFHLILNSGYSDESDFNMSKILRIPESKVKRLRYESSLVYQKDDKDYNEEFYALLNSRTFKKTNDNKLQFAVADKMLRLYLNNKLEAKGSFADSSFNSNIVTISVADLMILLSDFEGKKEFIENIKEDIKSNGNFFPQTMSEKTKGLFVAFIKDLGNKISPNIINFIIDNINK